MLYIQGVAQLCTDIRYLDFTNACRGYFFNYLSWMLLLHPVSVYVFVYICSIFVTKWQIFCCFLIIYILENLEVFYHIISLVGRPRSLSLILIWEIFHAGKHTLPCTASNCSSCLILYEVHTTVAHSMWFRTRAWYSGSNVFSFKRW